MSHHRWRGAEHRGWCAFRAWVGGFPVPSAPAERKVSEAIARKRVKQTWKDKSETVGRPKAEAQIQYSLAVPSGSRMISFPACLMLALS